MGPTIVELPVAFAGHTARMLATQQTDGTWHVTTEVDGRVRCDEHCTDWRRVEQYQARMQLWLRQAEDAEQGRRVA